MASTASAGASPPPQVDTTFRPTNVNSILGERPSSGKWAKRSFMALFALCSAVAAAGWQHYGDEAKQMIASWTPSFALSSLLHTETPPSPSSRARLLSKYPRRHPRKLPRRIRQPRNPCPRNRYLRRKRRRPLHRRSFRGLGAIAAVDGARSRNNGSADRAAQSQYRADQGQPGANLPQRGQNRRDQACRDQAV